jgi:hypothetical protein
MKSFITFDQGRLLTNLQTWKLLPGTCSRALSASSVTTKAKKSFMTLTPGRWWTGPNHFWPIRTFFRTKYLFLFFWKKTFRTNLIPPTNWSVLSVVSIFWRFTASFTGRLQVSSKYLRCPYRNRLKLRQESRFWTQTQFRYKTLMIPTNPVKVGSGNVRLPKPLRHRIYLLTNY